MGVGARKKRSFCAGHISSPLPVCAQGGELPASRAEREALPSIFGRRMAFLSGERLIGTMTSLSVIRVRQFLAIRRLMGTDSAADE
jgi:hypothetical protein